MYEEKNILMPIFSFLVLKALLRQNLYINIKNWENVIVPTYGLTPNTYNKSLGVHEISAIHHPGAKMKVRDNKKMIIYKFRKLFSSIEKKDPSLWLAMCRLILIDYICFPQYELPYSCRSLQSDVDKGRAMLVNS